MYQVYEFSTGKRRYIGNSFAAADETKENLERMGVRYIWVFVP